MKSEELKKKPKITKSKFKKLILGGISTEELNSKYDYSHITDMTSLFRNCKSLESVPLFDTSNVTSMKSMFRNCQLLDTVPLFDTSNVTDMSYMFDSCLTLSTVPKFDTSKVTDMKYTFRNCLALRKLYKMNTKNVYDMTGMFINSSLQKCPNFNTSNVEYFFGMFACSGIKSFPKFDTSKALNMDLMFLDTSIEGIDYDFDFYQDSTHLSNYNVDSLEYTPFFFLTSELNRMHKIDLIDVLAPELRSLIFKCIISVKDTRYSLSKDFNNFDILRFRNNASYREQVLG